MATPPERPVEWMGSSLDDLRDCPEEVQDVLGYAIDLAQHGRTHPDAKQMHGNLREVMEVVADERGDTYRGMYTVRLAGVVYVLHVFKKKSTRGIKTPQRDIDLIEARLKTAKAHYAKHYASRLRGR